MLAYFPNSNYYIFNRGIKSLKWGLKAYRIGRESRNWSETEGEIIVSETKWDKGAETDKASIKYVYTVDGNKYSSNYVTITSIKDISVFSWGSKKFLREYPVGKKVKVFYNPYKPSLSLLVPGLRIAILEYFMLGVFLIGLGGSLILSSIVGIINLIT